jgi:hypothetical protein
MHHSHYLSSRVRTTAGQLAALRAGTKCSEGLFDNRQLCESVALRILDSSPNAAESAKLARLPVGKQERVRERLLNIPKVTVLNEVLCRNGMFPEMLTVLKNAKSVSPKTVSLLLHHFHSLTPEDTAALAEKKSHALTMAAALVNRPSTEQLLEQLDGGKTNTEADLLVRTLLVLYPELLGNEQLMGQYTRAYASSLGLGGNDEVVENILRKCRSFSDPSHDGDTMQGTFALTALIANPAVSPKITNELYRKETILSGYAHWYRKRNEDTWSFDGVETASEAALKHALSRVVPRKNDYNRHLRLEHLHSLLAAKNAPKESISAALLRLQVVLSEYPREAQYEGYRIMLSLALPELQKHDQDTHGKVSAFLTGKESSFTRQPFASYPPSPYNYCTGCSDAEKFNVVSWMNTLPTHLHVLEDAWGENSDMWDMGFSMIDTFTGSIGSLAHLVSDTFG